MQLGKESIMTIETKYDFDFSAEEINKEIMRLTNQIWKLIPMRENNEPW